MFDHYGPKEQGAIAKRQNGVMIANAPGATPAYSLGPLEERGKLFAAEGDNVYEGQLIGIHSKDNDLTVNAIKTKPLTNMRASGKDEAIKLTPGDQVHAGAGAGLHRGRRAGRSHARRKSACARSS